jgi:hypothetical protein
MTNNGQKIETKFKTVRLFNHWINPSIKVVTIHRIESEDIKELYRGVSDKIFLLTSKRSCAVYRNTNMLPSS